MTPPRHIPDVCLTTLIRLNPILNQDMPTCLCPQGRESMTNNPNSQSKQPMNRRSLLKTGIFAGGAVAMAGAGLLATSGPSAFAQQSERNERLTRGDVAILRFL